MTVFALTVALLPAVLLWLSIWKKDPQKEPTSWLLKAIFAGVAICIPISFFEMGIQSVLFGLEKGPTSLFGTTVDAFLVAALPEESFKLLALWLILRKNPSFDEHFDGIVYAVCIGLGFAAVENIMYIVNEEEWFSVAIARALLAVPGHYAFAVLMGYYYSVYHFVDCSKKIAACTLMVPVAAHGIYDSLALSGLVDPTIGGLCFIVLIYFCLKMHKVAESKVLAQIEKDDSKRNITS